MIVMTTGDVIDDVTAAPPIKLRSSDCTRKLYSVEETISVCLQFVHESLMPVKNRTVQ